MVIIITKYNNYHILNRDDIRKIKYKKDMQERKTMQMKGDHVKWKR
jgi:hypothetical protein